MHLYELFKSTTKIGRDYSSFIATHSKQFSMVSLKVLFVVGLILALVDCSSVRKSKNDTEPSASKTNEQTTRKGKVKDASSSKNKDATNIKANTTIPCTCGVFLTGQFIKGSNEQPKGDPALIQEINKVFLCNVMGQKQCQTKCLEAIVGHLPNSANVLCATLDRDCHKERAYLFIKNCKDVWVNTNLAAGKEYCCKDGEPYTCPLV